MARWRRSTAVGLAAALLLMAQIPALGAEAQPSHLLEPSAWQCPAAGGGTCREFQVAGLGMISGPALENPWPHMLATLSAFGPSLPEASLPGAILKLFTEGVPHAWDAIVGAIGSMFRAIGDFFVAIADAIGPAFRSLGGAGDGGATDTLSTMPGREFDPQTRGVSLEAFGVSDAASSEAEAVRRACEKTEFRQMLREDLRAFANAAGDADRSASLAVNKVANYLAGKTVPTVVEALGLPDSFPLLVKVDVEQGQIAIGVSVPCGFEIEVITAT